MSQNVVDSGALELVRAGLITYRQLNEVHRLIQETGGDLESTLVERGYVSAEELRRRRPRAAGAGKLKLARSLDLVKGGLLSFKQLNECHRAAREGESPRSVLEVAIEKGYVTELQAATLPPDGAREPKSKRFSSSWDLFRAGMVSLKALNECHRHVQLESPGKTLKEALLERGYVSQTQLEDLAARKARGESIVGGGAAPSAFRQRYAQELEQIPPTLREELRRERVRPTARSEPPSARLSPPARPTPGQPAPVKAAPPKPAPPKAAPAKAAPPQPAASRPAPSTPPVAAKPPAAPARPRSEEEELRAARTVIDLQAEEDGDFRAAQTFYDNPEAPAAEEDVELRSARTMMDAAEADEADLVDRSARTFLDAGEADDEGEVDRGARTFLDVSELEDGAPEVDRSARTFLDASQADEDEEGVDRSAMTMVDASEAGPAGRGNGKIPVSGQTIMVVGQDDLEPEDAAFRAARTFLDASAADEEEEPEGEDLRSARTFLDANEAAETEEEDVDLRSARTFLDSDTAEVAPSSGTSARTFMDLGDDFQAEQTSFDAAAQARKKTFLDDSGFGQPDGQTFMDVGVPREQDESRAGSRSGASGPALADATSMDVAGEVGGDSSASRTEFDAGGVSRSRATGSTPSTRPGGGTEADGGTSAGDSAASRSSAGQSSAGQSSAGQSSAGASSPSAASRTEAEAGESRVKRQTKRRPHPGDQDAYSHPLVGKVIGNCRIVKKLGEGGMGAVFLAEHSRLKRQSVIKVIPAHLASNKQLIARFTREAESAARIQHPNVVTVFNVGEENSVHFIEMEYVDGKGLDALMKEKKVLEPLEAVRIIKECCKGLQEAHKQGIVHRDIKPDNVMMTRKGQVKLADFGLARAASTEQMELTKVGQILGTPAYMSPEQCQGKPTDHRCDIYSLGATFYAMVTGKRPFTGQSVMEIIKKHVEEEPLSPRELNPDLSQPIAKVILKMMAKKPEDRFQEAEEVVAALDQILREEGTDRLAEVQKAIGAEYRLLKKLGQGGMGAVYSARATVNKQRVQLGDVVALKVLAEDVDQDEVDRFRQEAELALKIDHPNIIRVLDHKSDKGVNFIVMEFVEGESVRDLLRHEKNLPEKEAIRIVKQACQGLKRAHELGIIHRDIKPDNLMRAKDGAVKIADFGIAKHVESRTELTQAGFLVGTPHYMSPEQCSAKGLFKVGTQADIYALGATLYYMVTGQKPFEGETQAAILLQHLQERPNPPRQVNPELSEGLENVILNMMAKKPPRRYATVDEVLADLEKVEKGGVPRKRRGIDTPLEETHTARRTLSIAGLVVLLMGMFITYEIVTGDQRRLDRINQELAGAYTTTRDRVRELNAAKQYAQARLEADGLIPALQRLDASGADKWEEYKDEQAELLREVREGKEQRDAAVAAAWAALESGPLAAAERELRALQARLEVYQAVRDEPKEDSLAAVPGVARREEALRPAVGDEAWRALLDLEAALRRARGAAGATPPFQPEDYRPAAARDAVRLAVTRLDQVDEKSWGDAPQVPQARARREKLVVDLQGLASLSVRLLDTDADARYRLQELSGNARAKQDELSRNWTERADSPLKIAVGGEGTGEPERELSEAGRRVLGDIHDLLYQLARGLGLAPSAYKLEELLRELRVTKQPLPFNELLNACEKVIEATGQLSETIKLAVPIRSDLYPLLKERRRELRQFLLEGVTSRVAELARQGKYRTALSALDGDLQKIQASYRAGKDDAELAEVSKLVDGQRGNIAETIARIWREDEQGIQLLAWNQRRFRQAAARYQAIIDNDEYGVALGESEVTIQELARRGLERLRPHLALLAVAPDPTRPGEAPRGVVIPAGAWQVGSEGSGAPSESPAREVTLPEFYLDRTEVTVRDYREFLRTATLDGRPRDEAGPGPLAGPHKPSPFCHVDCPGTGHAPAYLLAREGEGQVEFSDVIPMRPVVQVSYYDAWAYARWAGKRLPREVEWEVAASGQPGGGRRAYPWGQEFDREALVCSQTHDKWDAQSLVVAGSIQKGASPFGVLDMAGSVWEWCDDRYGPYPGQSMDADPDFGLDYLVIRGGSFTDYYPNTFRCAFRNRARPGEARVNVGFRCAWDPLRPAAEKDGE